MKSPFQERRRGNEAGKEERQEPGVGILSPLKQDHQTDDEKQQRIGPENLVGNRLCGRQRLPGPRLEDDVHATRPARFRPLHVERQHIAGHSSRYRVVVGNQRVEAVPIDRDDPVPGL